MFVPVNFDFMTNFLNYVAVECAGRVRVIFMCGSCAGHSSDSSVVKVRVVCG